MQTRDFIIVGSGSGSCVPIGIIDAEIRPGRQRVTDAELIADVRARSGTVLYPTGTCHMRADRADMILSDHAGD